MVVRSKEELDALLGQGFKPYYHRGVGRWYLRRGQVRHIIDRSLECYAEELAEGLKTRARKFSDSEVARAIKMRLEEAPVSAIVEETGIPRSTLYNKFEKYDSGELQLELPKEATQGSSRESMPAQEVAVSSSESVKGVDRTKINLPNFDEVLKNIGDWTDQSKRFLERILSEPEVVGRLADLGTLLIIFSALPRLREMGVDTTPMLKTLHEILAKYENNRDK